MSPLPGAEMDFERLSRYFAALGIPSRIALLRKLKLPHAVADITLPPSRQDRERSPDRPLSRQTVEEHLARLQDLGLVLGRDGVRDGRVVKEFVVNHGRLFVLVEELRQLSLLCLTPGLTLEATQAGNGRGALPAVPEGPALVLVSGPLESVAFPLAGAGPWAIGREKGLAVSIPYDPFVSRRNTEVFLDDGRFHVRSLEEARNGTRLNWHDVRPGTSVPLRAGDTLGVGRSLLLFREGE